MERGKYGKREGIINIIYEMRGMTFWEVVSRGWKSDLLWSSGRM